MLIAAAALALVPACHELEVTEAELVALEEQAASEESVLSAAVSPASFTTLDTDHNWYSGGTPNDEQTVAVGLGNCPAGSAVVGVQYFEGGNSDWVDGVGMACWGPTTGYTFHNWYSGGVRGGEQGTHGTGMGLCPWGRVVKGIQYFDGPGDAVDGLGVHCEAPRHINNWFPDHTTSEQGNRFPALGDCPVAGDVVVGIQYFDRGDWVDGIGIHCAPRPAGWPTP